jgi:hypothetical protein
MGFLKPTQTHLVVIELKGTKQKNITAYMKMLRTIAATYGATVRSSQKVSKPRPAARKTARKAAKRKKRR